MTPKVWFQELPAKLHGGMQFKAKCIVWVLSPTRQHPRRFERLFSAPTKAEAEVKLRRCHQYRNGWTEVDRA